MSDLDRNGSNLHAMRSESGMSPENAQAVHPAWQALIRYCEKLQFGELEKISIQNGLPMTVEVVRTKMRLRTE